MTPLPLNTWDRTCWKDGKQLDEVFAADTAIGWVASEVAGNEASFFRAFDETDLEGLRKHQQFGPRMHYVLAGTSAKNTVKGIMIFVGSDGRMMGGDEILASKELPFPPEIKEEQLSLEAQQEVEKVFKEASVFRNLFLRQWHP